MRLFSLLPPKKLRLFILVCVNVKYDFMKPNNFLGSSFHVLVVIDFDIQQGFNIIKKKKKNIWTLASSSFLCKETLN